jgi:hypothetical protein
MDVGGSLGGKGCTLDTLEQFSFVLTFSFSPFFVFSSFLFSSFFFYIFLLFLFTSLLLLIWRFTFLHTSLSRFSASLLHLHFYI